MNWNSLSPRASVAFVNRSSLLTVLVAAVLLPALALSAPPPAARRRVSGLVIPMDKTAEENATKLEDYLNEALERYEATDAEPPDELFGTPLDEDAHEALERARHGFEDSKGSFEAHKYDEAERKLRATLRELQNAAPAMRGCSPLCETIAMYGAALHARGDVEEARLALLDLIALDPTFELSLKRYAREFVGLRAQVATSPYAELRGGLMVATRPAGARVFLDGEMKGYSPLLLDGLPVGKHLLRFERPGFVIAGRLVEVTPADQRIEVPLQATKGYAAYDSHMTKVAGEIIRDQPGVALRRVGTVLQLDRVLFGVLRGTSDKSTSELTLALVDLATGRKLAGRKMTLQGDLYGQLKQEIVRAVNNLMHAANGGVGKKSKSSDPLDHRAGTEDWNEDSNKAEKKRKKSDPLDGVNGMEDW